MPRNETVTKNLKYDLTEKEVTQYGRDIAKINSEIGMLQENAKATAADYKSRIAEKEVVSGRLSTAINSGFEWRDIECRWDFNTPDMGYKSLIRLDTFEPVEVREMAEYEKQQQLDLDADA